MKIAALLVALVAFAPAASGATVDEFEKAAAVPERFLEMGCVVYGRVGRDRGCADQAGAELIGRSYPVVELEALTRHRNPRVRTLALVFLFETLDPKLLPVIFTLVDDTRETFPARVPVAYSPPGRTFNQILKERQTVGEIAEQLLSFYLRRAGYSYGVRGGSCPGFEDYWALRKGRAYLAGWFAVQLDRATEGTSPMPSDRGAAFAALRSRLDALGDDDRLWYSLFVGTSEGGERVFTEAESLAFGKALGPDRLMAMLALQAPESDPDLAPKNWPTHCGRSEIGTRMRWFVLDHAAILLRPGDAPALLASPEAKYATWAIGAAAVRPDRAEEILKRASANLDGKLFGWDQARMAAALVRIAGPSHTAYALDWFYSRLPDEPLANAQEGFIRDVVERSGPGGRALLASLVLDPRLETISESAFKELINRVNAWVPTPLVERPYDYVSPETRAAVFGEWRRRVRESVPQWNVMTSAEPSR